MRRNLADTHVRHLPHQGGQREQVADPKAALAPRQRGEGVGPLYVRPARRQRTYQLATRLSVEDAVLAPGMAIADQLVLTTGLRVEWVGNSESPRIAPTTCS